MLIIIPARSGSKGVPNKNIRLLNSKPLSQWSLDFASTLVSSKVADEIVFSSDSTDYLDKVCLPKSCSFHHRSEKSSCDHAPASSYVSEILKLYSGHKSFLILQPTCPFRNITNAINMFNVFQSSFIPTLISVFEESYISDLVSYNAISTTEAFQLTDNNNKQTRRQDHSARYIRSGSYYFVDTSYFLETNNLVAPKTLYYIESKLLSINIDTIDDLLLAQSVSLTWNQF